MGIVYRGGGGLPHIFSIQLILFKIIGSGFRADFFIFSRKTLRLSTLGKLCLTNIVFSFYFLWLEFKLLFVIILENNFWGNFNFDLTEKFIHVEDFY